jgi:hypothetical protein
VGQIVESLADDDFDDDMIGPYRPPKRFTERDPVHLWQSREESSVLRNPIGQLVLGRPLFLAATLSAGRGFAVLSVKPRQTRRSSFDPLEKDVNKPIASGRKYC